MEAALTALNDHAIARQVTSSAFKIERNRAQARFISYSE